MFKIEKNSLTPEIFNILVGAVGWGHPSVNEIAEALKNSLYTVCIVDNDKYIAMGRIVYGSNRCFFIKDVAVLPEYQGIGVGKLLIEDMLKFIKSEIPYGWKACVELMSAHGKEGFYEQFGFEKKITQKDWCAMRLRLRNVV